MRDRPLILIVEDELPLRRLMAMMLERHGYRAVQAANGLEGLEKIRELGPPAAALVDLMMPVMDGETFARAAREHHTFPMILVSASPEAGDIAATLELDFLAKPYDFDVLIDRLRTATGHAAA